MEMSNKNLLILGAGEYGAVAKETAETTGCFERISFLDDDNPAAIGKLKDYEKFVGEYACAFVAIGRAKLRRELLQKLEESGYRLAVLVNPRACVSPSAQIMKGTIIEAGAVINTGAVIGIGCIVSANAVVNHNSFVGDCSHIDCNATVLSGTIVPAETKVASNCCYCSPKGVESIEGVKEYSFEDGM